jgi:hypothetical protein
MQELSFISLGAPSNQSSGGAITGAELDTGGNFFNFGSNVLTIGNGGADQLFGDMQYLTLSATAPNTLDAYGSVVGGLLGGENILTFGVEQGTSSVYIGNTLTAGNGAGNQLYGSVEDVLFIESSNSGSASLIGGGFPYNGSAQYNQVTLGNNTLTAGNGAGDQLYGDLHDLTFNAYGLISNASAGVIGGTDGGYNAFNFGNNTLVAGNGDGDQLYGTLHDINLSATVNQIIGNGDDANGTPGDSYNLFQFGNNTLTAGNGNDTLYADMHNLIVNVDSTSLIKDNIININGTSVINAGNGNDTLVGVLNEIQVTGETIAQFLSQNTINSAGAHTNFNLGSGVDTLVFDASINMGTNIVNNFNAAKDILEFTNATATTGTDLTGSLNTSANVHFSSDGLHGTLATFTNGGSIDFTNVAYTHQTSLLSLVNNQASHLVIV